MSAARRSAERYAEQHSLSPLCSLTDLVTIAKDTAEVRQKRLPSNLLGIAFRAHRFDRRDVIYLDNDLSGARFRFTLAHEMAHLRLPWHLQAVGCIPRYWSGLDQCADEIEANEWAAELLVPSRWLVALLDEQGTERGIRGAYAAKASVVTVTLQLARVLGPGWAFVISDGLEVQYAGQSSDTNVPLPTAGSWWRPEEVEANVDEVRVVERGSNVHWFFYDSVLPVGLHDQPSTELLAEILADAFSDPGERASTRNSVNGIVGSANTRARRPKQTVSAERMHAVLRQRLSSRPELRLIIEHPLFDAFVEQKARELSSRPLGGP